MNSQEPLDTFGQRLAHLRKGANMTQQALSSSIGVARSNLTKYEQNKVKPTSDVIVSICEYFKVSADWLLRGIKNSSFDCELNNSEFKEILMVLRHINADPDPDVHTWAKVQFKKAFAEYYEALGLDKNKHRLSGLPNTDEDAATIDIDNSNIA